jgi:hypothetical protein
MAGPAKGAGMAPEKPILCYLKKNIKNDNRESHWPIQQQHKEADSHFLRFYDFFFFFFQFYDFFGFF